MLHPLDVDLDEGGVGGEAPTICGGIAWGVRPPPPADEVECRGGAPSVPAIYIP